jgi:CysZ protein
MMMLEVFAALSKALRDLTRAAVLWHALWPPLAALLLWTAIGFAAWAHGVALMERIVPGLPWAGWEWVAQWAAVFLLLAAFAALTYITAILLVAVFALPLLINLVAAHDYPDLGRHGENVFWGSLGNTLGAGAIFLIGSLAMLPLLLITRRLAGFAAALERLAESARLPLRCPGRTRDAQRNATYGARGWQEFLHGRAGNGRRAYVPLLNLLAPAFAALVFVHLGLAALRRRRQEGGVVL